MAKLVGVPCWVAVMQVLEGKVSKGLLAPYTPEICDPLREEIRRGRRRLSKWSYGAGYSAGHEL